MKRHPIRTMLLVHALGFVVLFALAIAVGTQEQGSIGQTITGVLMLFWLLIGVVAAPTITIVAILIARRNRPPRPAPKRPATPRPAAPSPAPQPLTVVRPLPTTPPRPEVTDPVEQEDDPPPTRQERRDAELTWHRASATPRPVSEPAPTSRRALRDRRPAPPRLEYFVMGADNYPWMEVEGEFARVDAILKVVGRKLRLDEEIELSSLPAELRPEPTNPHDRNAVMVLINGHHIGYIGRADAAIYQEPLTRLIRAGVTPMARARLWIAARRDWDGKGLKHHARVTLAIGKPDMLAPVNNPPEAPYSLIPWGTALQVTGEEHHLDVLGEYVSPSGESVAIGSLHVIEVPAAKGATKQVVEVRIDGDRIGQMTPGSSQHYLPTIRHLADQGLQTAAWLKVKGSAIAAEAVLQAARAHELPADWFGTPATIPAIYPRRTAPPSLAEDAEDGAEITGARPAPMWDDV